MPVKIGEREYRMMSSLMGPPPEGRPKLIESDFYVEGYITTFNQPYELFPGYNEQVDRGALDGADMADVIFQYDHEGMVMARTGNGTLLLRADDHGIFIAADLSLSQAGRDLYEAIKNGLVTKMSWAFVVAEDEFDYESDTRTILRIKKVYDASAVSIPANDASEISARSYVDGAIAERERESRVRTAKALDMRARL